MKGGTPGCPEIPDWLATNTPEGSRIGIDPFLHTVSTPVDKLPFTLLLFAVFSSLKCLA